MSQANQSTLLPQSTALITDVVILDRTASDHAGPPPLARIDDLLQRMRLGDRQAAAEFLDVYGTRLRRRIRGKLGLSMRRLFDSLDVLSTVGRRLDLYVMSGRLTAVNEGQLWALVFRMADNAVIDKARLFRHLQATEGEDSEFARDMVLRLQRAEIEHSSGVELEIERCLQAVNAGPDRRILSLWLSGETLASIADTLKLSASAVRKRWEAIKVEFREQLKQD